MSLRTIIIALAATVALTTSAVSQAQRVLRAGTNPAGPPISFLDAKSNAFRGVSIELMAEIAKDAGFQVEYTPMSLAELIPALTSNKIDIIVANMLATPERKALIDFSEPYHASGDALVVARTDPKQYKSIADLKDMVIGTQKGSAQLTAIQKTGLFPDVKLYDNFVAVMRDVSAGGIAAGIVGRTAARYQFHLGNFSDLRVVTSYQPMIESGDAFGVRKGDSELLRTINASLVKLQANGTLAKILANYGL